VDVLRGDGVVVVVKCMGIGVGLGKCYDFHVSL